MRGLYLQNWLISGPLVTPAQMSSQQPSERQGPRGEQLNGFSALASVGCIQEEYGIAMCLYWLPSIHRLTDSRGVHTAVNIRAIGRTPGASVPG